MMELFLEQFARHSWLTQVLICNGPVLFYCDDITFSPTNCFNMP